MPKGILDDYPEECEALIEQAEATGFLVALLWLMAWEVARGST